MAGRLVVLMAFLMLSVLSACSGDDVKTRLVNATAYNSFKWQTSDTPFVGAWGDKLKPGIKAIAVSRDLLKKGLTRGTKVKIEGLKGEYTVLDKMNRRWRNKIDIYFGVDLEAAREWGKRKVEISWTEE
ncbi:3D domain-containing protein [Maridesulfovibrio bastinii]|uniref:3D domain-containing protein n=1 Tax=Maridesulfovibrio bastinii TaxID=47157 RepID=UPI000412E484|nr:3D domain-containing protein [Maridesulfovibrio bastinii]